MTGLFQFSMVSSRPIHVVRVPFLFNLLIHIYLLAVISQWIYISHFVYLFICQSTLRLLLPFRLLWIMLQWTLVQISVGKSSFKLFRVYICYIKEVSHKRLHIAWVYLYKMFRLGKSRLIESLLVYS